MKNMDQYFVKKDNKVYFTGKTLNICIPMRYESLGALEIGEHISALGIFDMEINGEPCGFFLPAKIGIEPHEVNRIVVDGERCLYITILNGGVFIRNTNVVQDTHLGYVIFYEMVYGGNLPKFITYNNHAFMFDEVTKVTGLKFSTDHTVFEVMTSLLYRSKDDLGVLYRHTSMKHPPKLIPLRLVSHAATSTTSRIVGAYDEDGFDAALVNASEINSEIEDLLRR
jgi:hypothetical protein